MVAPSNERGSLLAVRMASKKQRAAAKKNIKKAAKAAKKKRTIANLPKSTRTALAKQANAVKKKKRARSSR